MAIYKLKKPVITKTMRSKVYQFIYQNSDVFTYVESANNPRYLFWDKVRYRPRPPRMTAEEFWALIKLLRNASLSRERTVIQDDKNNNFSWQRLPGLDKFLHEVDMELGGKLESGLLEDQFARQRFITRGIMEEAIASSQLEGASTTRKVAKQMLFENRSPSNHSERMIVNNYRAMLAIEHEYRNESMSVELLLTLHETLTVDTINKDEVGRFRKDKDEVVVSDPVEGIIYHIPPPEKILKREMKKFVQFANDKLDSQRFMHPLIKAIVLHFWIGYLHPFTDGNGRMARVVFYWYLLRNDYWAFSYLPISKMIRKSPAQYRDAYVYAEQDDNDLTYFIDYLVHKIQLAKLEFKNYVKRTESENRKMALVARAKYHLNDRQIQLLRYLHNNSGYSASIKIHSYVNRIGRLTARTDLEKLENLGFLISQKIGRDRPFRSTPKASELF